MSRYIANGTREILRTTTLYSDGKTQVPKEVIQYLKLQKGSQIVWIRQGDKIIIESPNI